jgi:hypothetical protein
MPFSFPSSPTNGQQSTQNGRVYQWTGSAWELVPGTITAADIGAAAASHTHTVSQLSATGTASASTFLRGDGAWAAAPVASVNGQTGAVTVAVSAKKFWWM